jgi:hypothetical protein
MHNLINTYIVRYSEVGATCRCERFQTHALSYDADTLLLSHKAHYEFSNNTSKVIHLLKAQTNLCHIFWWVTNDFLATCGVQTKD